jgi:hypothetical protein
MNVIILFILFSSLSVSAQIVTGGGTIINDDEGGTIGIDPLDTEMRMYANHLKDRERECTGEIKLIKEPDLMQVYLALSVYKSVNSKPDKCAEANKYFSCLSDKQAKKMFKKIALNKKIIPHIRSKYSLNKNEASTMLKFFQHLEKE